MACPICDKKAANCDCTALEISQHERIAELEEKTPQARDMLIDRLTDAIDTAIRKSQCATCGEWRSLVESVIVGFDKG